MLVLLSILVCAYAQDNPANLSVNTTQGVVIGSRATDGYYYTFYGLHYGGNTAGQNRFKAPTPPPTYPGEYYAVDNRVICAQPSPRGLIGVEDCLVLNVFTQNATGNRSVVVWLESEDYTTTRQELFSFKKLVERDLVVVSINHRLSIFGFLCLGVPDAPGNAGIKDVDVATSGRIAMLLLLSILVCAYAQDNPANLSVNTTQGVVIGSRAADGYYYTFYGLHYGGNTAGQNRFKAPTPPPTYPGEYYAVDNRVICAQPSPRGLIGVEDCLVLNVFTQNATGNRSVVVWLESEDYTTTRQELFSFKKLVEQDLVVVSINHRLSIFGFLCLGVPDAPGNAGIKDVIQALNWIQLNIAGFGGDPNNVALLAHGSGAVMAELLSLSPLSRNLVHKVIAISGSALSPWAVAYEPVEYAKRLGEKLSYTDKSNTNLAQLLASTDLNILVPALNDFEFYNNTPLFGPCVENPTLGAERVLTDAPINLISEGNYNHIPYIAVFVDREGTVRAEQAAVNGWLDKMDTNFTEFIPVDLKFESENNKNAEAQKIREFYFAQKVISMDTIEDFLDYQGDTLISVPIIRGVAERAKTSKSPVRLMEFAYRGTHNSDWSYPQIPLSGARHGALLNYLFDFDLRPSDEAIQNSILMRFVSFVKYGDPNPTNFVNPRIQWNPYTPETTIALRISGDDEITSGRNFQKEVRINIHQQKMDFWYSMYRKYYYPPQKTSSAEKLFSLSLVLILSQILIKLM